jgi:hypothetical protein
METRQWQDKPNLYPLKKSNLLNPRKRTTFSMMAIALSYSSNPAGVKIWQFRYIRPVTKKRAKKSIGPYPSVTLDDARNYQAGSHYLLAKQEDAVTKNPLTNLNYTRSS